MLSFWYQTRHISTRIGRTLGASFGIMSGFLAIMRLLYEISFPRFDWSGRIEIVLPIAILLAIGTGYFLPRFRLWWLPLPLLFNLLWLLDPTVNPTRSLILFSSTLLAIVLFWLSSREADERTLYGRWLFPLILVATIGTLYLQTMSHNVGMADTFEFQVTAPKLGIVHPTGYPLYLMLGKLWTLIPFDSVAWRLNFGTAVYGIAALFITFRLLVEIGRPTEELGSIRPWVEPSAFVATLILGTLPIVWGQSIAAEVYSLHLLFAAGALWLMNRLLTGRINWETGVFWLALWLGLSMTNHVTSVFTLPAAALVMWLTWPKNKFLSPADTYWGRGLQLAFTFLIPLSLYAYLPIRWRAVNDDPMGFNRFIEWVIGGRFQDALQLQAPFTDPQRIPILFQLIFDQWPFWLLALALVGLITLLIRRLPLAIALLITAAGYTYYTLSYYVPDLAVFMLPIHLILAIFCGFGLMTLIDILNQMLRGDMLPAGSFRLSLLSRFPILLLIPLALLTALRFDQLDQSPEDNREQWARATLRQDLAPHAAILADSEKHPPLYYVQQTENLRRDLEIMILPNEEAYRAELDRRVAAGQTVYLARYLPQLAGIYSLQSAGPLTEVSNRHLRAPGDAPTASFDNVDLLDVEINPQSPFDSEMVQVDLTWRVNDPPEQELKVNLRWAGYESIFPAGRLPVNDFLPFNGADSGEYIQDFYQLPITTPQIAQKELELEIAVAPPFTPSADMEWQSVAEINLGNDAATASMSNLKSVRVQVTDRWNNRFLPDLLNGQVVVGQQDMALSQISLPETLEPSPIPAVLPANFDQFYRLESDPPAEGVLQSGEYKIYTTAPQTGETPIRLRCGWLRWPQDRCLLGTVTVSGVALPDDAINYANQIALLNHEITKTNLAPGGTVELSTTWQGLTKIGEDYTIFAQVLTEDDQIVGQLDIKPAQGTRPTNLWEPGEILEDRYVIPLNDTFSAENSHRLIIGFYRLSDFQRLTVVDPAGIPIGDHFVIPLGR